MTEQEKFSPFLDGIVIEPAENGSFIVHEGPLTNPTHVMRRRWGFSNACDLMTWLGSFDQTVAHGRSTQKVGLVE